VTDAYPFTYLLIVAEFHRQSRRQKYLLPEIEISMSKKIFFVSMKQGNFPSSIFTSTKFYHYSHQPEELLFTY